MKKILLTAAVAMAFASPALASESASYQNGYDNGYDAGYKRGDQDLVNWVKSETGMKPSALVTAYENLQNEVAGNVAVKDLCETLELMNELVGATITSPHCK